MEEYIGKVKMNYDFYSGEDLYSDGDIEDFLLDVVKTVEYKDYDSVIAKEKSWPVLYHLSDVRQNVINWYNFEPGAQILEIGAGCGAITRCFLEQGCKVTSLDLSKRRSLINANRHRDLDNLEIIVANFNDVAEALEQKFDYVTLIGVFEYADLYIGQDHAADVFLKKIKKLLKPNGKLIIAIENQLGLKYFAGCKEDHVSLYFEGIMGYPNSKGIRTYSKKVLSEILERNDLKNIKFYYPYPDYKLPHHIYSDEHLPQKGELNINIRNFDMERMSLFDESLVFDSIIDAGLFPEFSNSFLVIASEENI